MRSKLEKTHLATFIQIGKKCLQQKLLMLYQIGLESGENVEKKIHLLMIV